LFALALYAKPERMRDAPVVRIQFPLESVKSIGGRTTLTDAPQAGLPIENRLPSAFNDCAHNFPAPVRI